MKGIIILAFASVVTFSLMLLVMGCTSLADSIPDGGIESPEFCTQVIEKDGVRVTVCAYGRIESVEISPTQ